MSSLMAAASSSSAASSAAGGGDLPAPPPPTPSGHPLTSSNSTVADDALSCLLHRLLTAPTLSSSPLPRRLRQPSAASPPPPPPLISLHHHSNLLSAAATHGFFHLTDHAIPSHLPTAALSEAQSTTTTTTCSRLGFGRDDDCSPAHQVFDAGLGDLDGLPALREYALCLQNTALEVVDVLASAGEGFSENPFRNGSVKPRCLMWASTSSATEEDEEETGGRWEEVKSYPYVVCLQYEMSGWRKPCWLLDGDSGAWIPVVPVADSVLVTFGDIAQVWSNGRFKKVRGIPQPNPHENFDGHNHLSLSLLVTLPVDTIIYPLPLTVADNCDGGGGSEGDDNEKRFRAFPFDDYAWEVYHDHLPFKDPLLRYRN